MYQVKIFKGCLPQILLGPLLNTLTHLYVRQNQSFKRAKVITLLEMTENSQKPKQSIYFSEYHFKQPFLSKLTW